MSEVTLHLGDCLDILPMAAEGSVDAVITDPPFSKTVHTNARAANGSMNENNYGLVSVVNKIDFEPLSKESIRDAFALCRSRKWIISFMDWRYMLYFEEFPPDGLEFIRFGIWHKTQYAPQFSGDRPAHGWEAIAILHPPGTKKWNGGGKSAVWSSAVEHNNKHKTAKPLPLINKLVSEFSEPGDLVLDPFMGSGTTGVACVQLGRNFIGIEKEPKYFEIAKKRIEQAQMQMLLPLEM
jgi:site-specific DNA-methyltransferase (adenine-specific)